jgi:hypothetical protein
MTPDAIAIWIAFAGGPLCVSDVSVSTYETVVFKSPCEPLAAVPYVVTDTEMIEAPAAVPAKIAMARPVAKVKPRRRSSACGSKRMVWRTLRGGYRKYRCK